MRFVLKSIRPGTTALLLLVLFGLAALPAAAQDTTCPPFEGITCDGFVTDAAGVLDNDGVLESEAARIEGTYGAQVAVVTVPSLGGWSCVS